MDRFVLLPYHYQAAFDSKKTTHNTGYEHIYKLRNKILVSLFNDYIKHKYNKPQQTSTREVPLLCVFVLRMPSCSPTSVRLLVGPPGASVLLHHVARLAHGLLPLH